ncbi:hypothetical protein DER45DRAFT_575162 [Fusarium avenaceum]|nr:hypothetical protein DER45DRAFT_575162 [Fusarium avenaceum]
MSHCIQTRQRPLLPAAPRTPSQTIPHNILPRHPRVGVTIACETCRRRKVRCNGHRPRCAGCARAGSDCTYSLTTADHDLSRRFKHAEMERTENQNLIDLLRSRNHEEANSILDLLRQDTSVRDILRKIEHGDMLCELSLVPETNKDV